MHYSYRTEQSYVRWLIRFIHFHKLQHPINMGGPEIEEFLTDLAVVALRLRSGQAVAVTYPCFR